MDPRPEDKLIFDELEKALDEAPVAPGSPPQRFFPLGAHPATYRDRCMVDALRRVDPSDPPSEQTAEAIAYHVQKIVAFEAGQLEDQARYLRAWADVYGR